MGLGRSGSRGWGRCGDNSHIIKDPLGAVQTVLYIENAIALARCIAFVPSLDDQNVNAILHCTMYSKRGPKAAL